MNQSISAFLEGIPTFILSVLVVFVMLELLIIAIVLLSKLVAYFANKSKKIEVVEPKIKTTEEMVQVQQEQIQDELELIAVITAAIAASIGTSSDQLKVISLRKVHRKTI